MCSFSIPLKAKVLAATSNCPFTIFHYPLTLYRTSYVTVAGVGTPTPESRGFSVPCFGDKHIALAAMLRRKAPDIRGRSTDPGHERKDRERDRYSDPGDRNSMDNGSAAG